MYIVCFNGPPECGKDTLAQMLVEHMDSRVTIPVRQDSLSLTLRFIAYAMVGYQGKHLDGPDYAEFKNTRFVLGGSHVTGRQLMIDASERFLKPCYGQSVMADLFIARNRGFPGLLLIRDSGFQVEIGPLVTHAGSGNVYVVQVKRESKTFEFDSREWVNHPVSRHNMSVPNNGTLDDLRVEAGRIYGRLVNQMGWVL